jgi:hypothetical protein
MLKFPILNFYPKNTRRWIGSRHLGSELGSEN